MCFNSFCTTVVVCDINNIVKLAIYIWYGEYTSTLDLSVGCFLEITKNRSACKKDRGRFLHNIFL